MPTIIKNVLVFNGTALTGPQTITINGGLIAPSPREGTTIDGTGCTLLPGLIDSHVHIDQPSHLADCARLGVTTVCDMACQPLSTFKTMKAAPSPVKWLSAGQPAFSANSTHGKMFRMLGNNEKPVHTTDDAVEFVKNRIDDGVDYIKIIADAPGIEQQTLNKIQEEAARAGKMTIAHTAEYASFQRGLDAGFDILTHAPLDKKLSEETVKRMAGKVTAVPTLTMMEGFASSWLFWMLRGRQDFQNAIDSVTAMRNAGVKILVGTDTNTLPVFSVMRGESMHREMELLERAGLTPIEILQGATSLAAEQFGLADRGRIEEGLRADLVLVRGNPTETITDSRRIERVCVGGEEVELAQEASSCVVM